MSFKIIGFVIITIGVGIFMLIFGVCIGVCYQHKQKKNTITPEMTSESHEERINNVNSLVNEEIQEINNKENMILKKNMAYELVSTL